MSVTLSTDNHRECIRLMQLRGLNFHPRANPIQLAEVLCREVYGYTFNGDVAEATRVLFRFVQRSRMNQDGGTKLVKRKR